jgi:hypothetical protein
VFTAYQTKVCSVLLVGSMRSAQTLFLGRLNALFEMYLRLAGWRNGTVV